MLNQFVTTAPAYNCLFWAAVFAWEYRQNRMRPERRIMCWFMLVATVLYFGHFCYFNRYVWILPLSDTLYSGANLSVYPLYYFYVRRITTGRPLVGRGRGDKRSTPWWRTPLWLLLPALVMLTINALAYTLLPPEKVANFFHHSFYGKLQLLEDACILVWTHRAGTFLFFVLLIYVIVRSMQRLKAFRKRINDFYSYTEHRDMSSLMRLQTALLLTTFGSLLLNTFGKAFFSHSLLILTIPSIAFTILLFAIGYDAYTRPFTADNFEEEEEQALALDTAEEQTHTTTDAQPPQPAPPALSPAAAATNSKPVGNVSAPIASSSKEASSHANLPERILAALKHDELYLLPDLKLPQLAHHLGTNRNYLSQAISHEMDTTFSELVNGLRIDHAKKIMLAPGGNTLSNAEIALLSGFASESSFYRHFRKHEGLSPSAWIEQQ